MYLPFHNSARISLQNCYLPTAEWVDAPKLLENDAAVLQGTRHCGRFKQRYLSDVGQEEVNWRKVLEHHIPEKLEAFVIKTFTRGGVCKGLAKQKQNKTDVESAKGV